MSLKQSLGRTLHKFAADPLGTAANVWRKGVTDPLRYGAPSGAGGAGAAYDARRYWSNRFARHAESLRGPGDEGLSDEQNRREYEAAGAQFVALCLGLPIDYAAANVLEIGPGSGYYTDLLRQLGVRRYTGLDIAGSLLPALSERFDGFAFAQADAADLPLAGKPGQGQGAFDLIAIIDVIEHIVERRTLAAALGGLEGLLAPGGRLLIAPLMASSGRHLFYVHFWSQADVCACLPNLRLEALTPFRGGELAAFVRPPTAYITPAYITPAYITPAYITPAYITPA